MAQLIESAEVLTAEEAADYLRVPVSSVLELAERAELPGRQIGGEWRFLKHALADWLREGGRRERLLRLAGEAADDPYQDEMLEEIYRARGRPMVDDGQ